MPDADRIRALRAEGRLDEALALARERAPGHESDAGLQYEAACIHDRLGFGAQAAGFYRLALAGRLDEEQRRGAYIGLGSTLRAQGDAQAALSVLDEGLSVFPDSGVLKVLRSMVLYNLAHFKEAVSALLKVLAEDSPDPELAQYRRALRLYAEDVDRGWPGDPG
jgi:tetratricopeptide (TPR) repeat protein